MGSTTQGAARTRSGQGSEVKMAWSGVGTLISLSQDDLSGNSGSFTAYSRACLPGMTPIVVEHLSLLIIVQAVGAAKENLMDLSAYGVSYTFKKFFRYRYFFLDI